MTDTLSPTLTAWLARFTAEVAPQYSWAVSEFGMLRDFIDKLCPLGADYFHYTEVLIDDDAVTLFCAFQGCLSKKDVHTIINTADYEYESEDYSPALRTALLAACGVEEMAHASLV